MAGDRSGSPRRHGVVMAGAHLGAPVRMAFPWRATTAVRPDGMGLPWRAHRRGRPDGMAFRGLSRPSASVASVTFRAIRGSALRAPQRVLLRLSWYTPAHSR
jgi:hypothetical protein